MPLITEVASSSGVPEVPKLEWCWQADQSKPQYAQQLRFVQLSEETLLGQAIVSSQNNAQELFKLSKFTDPRVPWSSGKLSELALSRIESLGLGGAKREMLEEHVVPRLKELSAVKQETRVSTAGYRRQQVRDDLFRGIKPVLQSQFSTQLSAADSWKLENASLLSTLYYISLSSAEFIIDNWSTILPLLLNFFDDVEAFVKTECCRILQNLMTALDGDDEPLVYYFANRKPNHITQTGVATVFEETIKPCLLQLPTLTPPAKSLEILRVAYPTIVQLLKVSSATHKEFCLKVSEIVNMYCLASFSNVKDHKSLLEFLIDELRNELLPAIGNHVLLSLGKLLRVLLDLVADPFMAYTPEVLMSVLDTLIVIFDAVPQRIEHYRYDILGGVIKMWEHLDATSPVRSRAVDVVKRLQVSCVNFKQDADTLIAVNPALEVLLNE